MGMFSYAALGAVAGGADAYGKVRTEERADDRLIASEGRAEGRLIDSEGRAEASQIASEGRAQTIWEVRQKRLDEHGITVAKTLADGKTETAKTLADVNTESASVLAAGKAAEDYTSRPGDIRMNSEHVEQSRNDISSKSGATTTPDNAKIVTANGKDITSRKIILSEWTKIAYTETSDGYGGTQKVRNENIPGWAEYFNSQVAPQHHIPTSGGMLSRGAKPGSELTPEEIATGKADYNNPTGSTSRWDDKSKDFIPFNEADDDDAQNQALVNRQRQTEAPTPAQADTTKAPTDAKKDYPKVTTQAEYDSLPSGAIFTEDGKQYRKP